MGEQVKVDFARLKKEVPILAVLEHYGVQARSNGNGQLSGNCPLPTHTSKDSKGSFKVNAEMGIWCCKSTSCVKAYKAITGKMGGDAIDLVKALDGLTTLDAAKKLLEWFPQTGSIQTPKFVSETATDVNKPSEPVPADSNCQPIVNKPLSFELKGIAYHPYLQARGISEDLASQFGVGFFPGKGSMAGRIVFPIRDEAGKLLAYAGRAINGEEPKYKLPNGFRKSHVLFNRHAVTVDTVTVVEGFVGCMKVTEARFPCVALMGCTLSSEQEGLLLPFRFITLMLDPDEPGQNATKELLQQLATNHYVRIAPNTKPPDEMSADEIGNCLRYVCPIPKS